MPAAPIAKGPYYPHYYNQPVHPINKTNTTIAKSGVIIMCAVLIAAGYTVYENREQVKELVDKTRRKISLAMHTFAEEIMPSEPRQRHQPMAFSGRQLDGSGNLLRSTSRPSSRNRSRRNSADSITLRCEAEKTSAGSSREAYLADSALRHRPPYRGFSFDESEPTKAVNANTNKSPFDDDSSRILFDATAESAAAEAQQEKQQLPPQHNLEKTPSPVNDASSDSTLSPAPSEKGLPLSNDDAPPMIPAVLPIPVVVKVIDQPPPLPPRPSHPHYQETPDVTEPTVATAVAPPPAPAPAPPVVEEGQEEQEEHEEHQTTFSTSQPYWAIQQWTEDITGTADTDEHTGDLSASEVETRDAEEVEVEDHSAVQSLHSESEATSLIDSDEGESEFDDRVEFVSDMASSVGDTDGWSEVGSQFSEAERM
ncbi:hypothetical protein TWF694_011788 [Orbilia ellipsospora]|uniref:Uncharacterized protein n=1 Tax=Orbilia ellipsospora TaxID=2528407 RepID=A0AAV9X6A2_9PEZI